MPSKKTTAKQLPTNAELMRGLAAMGQSTYGNKQELMARLEGARSALLKVARAPEIARLRPTGPQTTASTDTRFPAQPATPNPQPQPPTATPPAKTNTNTPHPLQHPQHTQTDHPHQDPPNQPQLSMNPHPPPPFRHWPKPQTQILFTTAVITSIIAIILSRVLTKTGNSNNPPLPSPTIPSTSSLSSITGVPGSGPLQGGLVDGEVVMVRREVGIVGEVVVAVGR